jgi:prepilin-type N-terminal cleavage/methylation domain-containing protein
MRWRHIPQHGFSLVEMAVVLAILGLLLGTAMYTLSAQQQQRRFEETQRRLDHAREAVLGFAVANGRLPCPANGGTTGVEAEAPAGSGTCTHAYNGFLPAITLGFPNVDSAGFALDAWNNRIRYAVPSPTLNVASCTSGAPALPHFTSKTNLKQNGMSCLPNTNDLLLCKSTTPAPAPGSCGASNAATNTGTIVAVIYSTGPNFAEAPGGAGPDEAANLDGNAIFISHTPQPAGTPNPGGEFDDMLVWIPVGVLYGRLSTAGVLP